MVVSVLEKDLVTFVWLLFVKVLSYLSSRKFLLKSSSLLPRTVVTMRAHVATLPRTTISITDCTPPLINVVTSALQCHYQHCHNTWCKGRL